MAQVCWSWLEILLDICSQFIKTDNVTYFCSLFISHARYVYLLSKTKSTILYVTYVIPPPWFTSHIKLKVPVTIILKSLCPCGKNSNHNPWVTQSKIWIFYCVLGKQTKAMVFKDHTSKHKTQGHNTMLRIKPETLWTPIAEQAWCLRICLKLLLLLILKIIKF